MGASRSHECSVSALSVDTLAPAAADCYHLGCRFQDGADEYSGHGSHTAGIIAAAPPTTAGPENDGVAPNAKLAFYDLGSSRSGSMVATPGNLNRLYALTCPPARSHNLQSRSDCALGQKPGGLRLSPPEHACLIEVLLC